MNFTKTDNTPIVNKLRSELYRRFTAPIDGMWESLYIASSQHYLIENDNKDIGYCCIDDNDSLLQIFLADDYNYLMDTAVRSLIESKLISSASLSSIEPISFNACLSHLKSIAANTFCFQYSNRPLANGSSLNLELVSKEDMPAIKSFFKNQIDFDDNFGYAENLIKRNELYMINDSEIIIATGECRMSDSQLDIADLGVIVNKDYQGRGIATQVLRRLVKKAQETNRKPVCSTTVDNIASKKAIERAGFFCSHIIFDIQFSTTKIQEP
ncbi:MAG: GNAT family N-acetyltransferase [Bacteroidetes bacterium]|nr:GNAT family N-acetyltransferase [Bacteroidota bacterium]